MISPDLKIYFSGDSGYGAHYKEAGATFDGFDLAILDSGQYNEAWRYPFHQNLVVLVLDAGHIENHGLQSISMEDKCRIIIYYPVLVYRDSKGGNILDNTHFKDISILYIAKYAPKHLGASLPTGIDDEIYAKYHYAIHEILCNNFCNVDSSSDIAVLNSTPNVDFIFSLFNRLPFRNSEVFVSAVAEYYNIPYLGGRPNIRALAEDKHLAKMMALYAEVPTPRWKTYNIQEKVTPPDFSGPYFVKPRFGASSEYIDEESICLSWQNAYERIMYLQNNQQDVILEELVDGVYYTSPIINNFGQAVFLPCIKEWSNLIYGVVTYEQKRKIKDGLVRTISQDQTLQKQIHHYSSRIYSMITPIDYTRIDYMVSQKNGIPYFIEFNMCCNLGEHSSISQSAYHLGVNYEKLIMNIILSSMYRANLIQDTFGYDF